MSFRERRAAALRDEAKRRASAARHGILDHVREAAASARRLELRVAFGHLRAAVEHGAENARAEDLRLAADEIEDTKEKP